MINIDKYKEITAFIREKQINEYDPSLLIVTKKQTIEDIESFCAMGHRVFGENRVQEADEKYSVIRQSYPSLDLHLIGPLQTNKVAIALNLFDAIQTIDREKLLKELIKNIDKLKTIKTKSFYIQINIGKEQQKSGLSPIMLKDFYQLCQDKNISIRGLMCIPPFDKDPEPFFTQMMELKKKINKNFLLSMGMSNDYKIAIGNGSNMIRVGSLLFTDV